MEALELISGFLDGIKPEPILTVSQWADMHRILSSVSSAEPGPYRSDRTPYLKEIQDNLSAHNIIETIVFMKAAQIGATEAGNNWCGYVASMVPAPMLMVMPTDETVKRNSKTRIDPMIESTPILRKKIAPHRSRDSNNTTTQKSFPGGVLVMTGANSAVALRSMPIRFLFLDEIDGYPSNLDGEGSPIDLAVARTNTFSRRKIFKVSTPTIDGASAIQREFMATDQRFYHVPCVHCGVLQKLIFSQIKWEKGDPYSAKYQCVHCSELIEERYKPVMLAEGRWVAEQPENADPKKVGYHLNSLYSPLGWFSWGDIIKKYEEAETDVNKMRTFVNTLLGECWTEKGDAPEWKRLFENREQYEINKPNTEVCFLTAGVDVQADRLEVEIVGWCKRKKSYSIDYRVLVGDTGNDKVWDQLAEIVNETWITEDGIQMRLAKMAVDTGYNTSQVYKFCRRFDLTRVIPVKGQDKQQLIVSSPKAVDTMSSGKKTGSMKVWNVGVSVIKSEFYGWLKQGKAEDGTKPNGYCSFPQYNPEYFRGLTAEHLESTMSMGFKKYRWVKKYHFNEPLDIRVYARAAASVVGMDRFQPIHYDIIRGTVPGVKNDPQVKKPRSSFWD